ncbi:PDZ domain-containing protein [Bacteriovorax sp. DB6_IX]|uniref:PDZ domain-containing protein n=1 Tax=Bacteriovorax sp. DB6_IX TaxID=1353530 RepID=UPI000389FBFD|nr:PDZ domain-containing protein [Bacteriovorax sp. DB6_IX]EQC51032.1 type IV pilus biogenesis [Bacteriovorax sp. DB6_IX]
MTKKKNGLFSKITDKLRSKKEDSEYSDEYEEEYELDSDEESEDEDEEDDEEYEYVDEDEEDSEEDSDDEDEEDDEEYEYVDEDEEDSEEDSDDEDDDSDEDDDEDDDDDDDEDDDDEDDDDDEEYEDDEEFEGTIEIEVPDEIKPTLLQKIKNKFSKSKDGDEEYEDHDRNLEELVEQPVAKNAVQSMISRLKNLKPQYESSIEKAPKMASSLSELTPEQWIPYLLGDQNKSVIHRSFIVALTVTGFYFAGKFVGLYLGQTKKSKGFTPSTERIVAYNPRMDVLNIKNNNIFNAKESLIDKPKPTGPKVPEVKVCKVAKTKSRLPLKLVNTIVLQDSVKSVASVSKRGKIFSYREGEKIDAMAEIGKIDRLKVVFKNLSSGSCEYIENVDQKAKRAFARKKLKVEPARKLETKGISGNGNRYTIKKSVRDNLLANIGEVLTQARAIQIKNPDGTLSYKMVDVVPGSIYSQLDIQNGDIVTGINGKKITSLNELMSMFGKLKQNDSYEISVKRNGTEKTLNYNFTE